MRDFEQFTRGSRRRSRWVWGGFLVVAFVLVAGLGLSAALPSAPDGGGEFARKTGGGGAEVFDMLASTPNGPQNVLIVGVDRRPEIEGTRADTIMLARVYPGTGGIRLVSIPRDLFVEIEPGEQHKINAAYSRGGVPETISAVENFTNVYVDHYAVVDFTGFEAIVDALGGVRVDVEEGEVPPHWKVKDEAQRLNGRRALAYARYRGTSGGDLDRIRHQQEILAALRSKALRWRSAKKVPEIARAAAGNVETDMRPSEITFLGRAVAEPGRNSLMTSTQLKGTPDTLPNGSEVLVPDYDANEEILRKFRRQ